MRNKLLITTALVAGFVANANALEYTPYVSAKAAFAQMQNNVNFGIHYAQKSNTDKAADGLYDKEHKNNVFGLRLATGAATSVVNGQIRTEFELGWNDNAEESHKGFFKSITNSYDYKLASKLSVYSAMINVYYDLDTHGLSPYVGAGIGLAHLKNKTSVATSLHSTAMGMDDTEKENHLAWNLAAGVNYALTDNLSLDAGYKYSNYGRIRKAKSTSLAALNSNMGTLSANAKLKVDAHEVLLGVRYTF